MLGVTLVTAFSLRDVNTDNKIQVTIDEDLDAPLEGQTKWEITIPPQTPFHTLKNCWVRVWVVKFCTFVIPDQVEAGIESAENEVKPLTETESCDQLGCTMFCKKNHFKRGVCHKKGCECDFM